jgi:hypothetical protein
MKHTILWNIFAYKLIFIIFFMDHPTVADLYVEKYI